MSGSAVIKQWTIYKITNPIGQVYIGKTFCWNNRVRQHRKIAHKNNTLISQSLIKFGSQQHQFEVIDTFDGDKIFADGKEMFWIRTHMSHVYKWPEMNGLNAYGGGQGNIGGAASERQKEIARQFHKGNKYALGRKEVIEKKELRIGKLKGQKRNPEQCKRLTESNIRLRGKSIIQYDLNGNYINEFNAISIASKFIGVNQRSIYLVLNGTQMHTKGFIFKYK